MKVTNFSKCNKSYYMALYYYAKRLEANEMIIHKNNSITLNCNDGCICSEYYPTKKELYGKYNDFSDLELAQLSDAGFLIF